MSDEITFKPKTFKSVDSDVLETYNRIKVNLLERNPEWNEGNVFAELVNRYSRPLKVDEANESRIRELEAQVAELQHKMADATARANSNAEAANSLQLDYEQQVAALKQQVADSTLKESQRVVDFLPDCLKAVEAVAARESKHRNQKWSISHVVNFFIYQRFIKGKLNGDLQSLSDSDCKRLGININLTPSEKKEVML